METKQLLQPPCTSSYRSQTATSAFLTNRLVRKITHISKEIKNANPRKKGRTRPPLFCQRIESKKLTPLTFNSEPPWQHISLQRCTADWQNLWPTISLQLNNLRILWFNYSSLTSQDILPMLPYLTNLLQLCMGQNQLDDEAAIAISHHLKKLQTLNLNVNRVTDLGAVSIALDLPKLQSFECRSNLLTQHAKLIIKAINSSLRTNIQ